MMSTPQELLEALQSQGIGIIAEGDCLRLVGQKTRLSESLRRELQEQKAALLEYLREQEGQVPSLLPQKVLRVRSLRLGGEEIVFAEDDACLPLDSRGRHEGQVVWRVSELQRLRETRPGPEVLRTLQEVKRELGGVYVGKEGARCSPQNSNGS